MITDSMFFLLMACLTYLKSIIETKKKEFIFVWLEYLLFSGKKVFPKRRSYPDTYDKNPSSRAYYLGNIIIHRPCAAGAVLQNSSCLIYFFNPDITEQKITKNATSALQLIWEGETKKNLYCCTYFYISNFYNFRLLG